MSLPFDNQTLFLTGSAICAWMSRKALARPASHGYYRFFAVEFLLGLLVLNRIPIGDQSVAQVLLALSVALVVCGYGALYRFGKPSRSRTDESLLDFERTTALVTGSVFRYIRHPMYASLIALAWAFFFRDPSLFAGALAASVSGLLFLTARADERECLAYFGDAYAAYMQRTRRFIPFLF